MPVNDNVNENVHAALMYRRFNSIRTAIPDFGDINTCPSLTFTFILNLQISYNPDNKVALSLLLVHEPIRAHIRRDNSQKVVDSFGRNFFRLDSLRETGKRPHEVHISDLHVRPYHLTYIRATKF